MDLSRTFTLMVIFVALSVNCIIVHDDEPGQEASEEQPEEHSPQAEALTYLRIGDKIVPVRQVQRRYPEEMGILKSRRDTPYRIKRRPRPKPKPKHIRRPMKPKPKYGPPNVNYKPLTHYNPHVMNDFYRDTFDKDGQTRLEYQSNGPPISFPSKTYGEPPMIPILNSNPHTSGTFGSMYNQLSFKPSLTRPSAQFNIGEPSPSKYQSSSGKYAEPASNDYNWNKIPLESNFGQDLYKTSISSYDVPTYDSDNIPSRNLFEPAPSQPPKLPSHYEQQDFRTPTRTHNSFSDKPNSNTFNFDDFTPNTLQKTTLNDVSESQRVQVKSKNKNPSQKLQTASQINFDELEKELRQGFPLNSDIDDDDLTHIFSPAKRRTTQGTTTTTTTTTPRPPRYQRRKKRPKFSSTTQHNLDTDDLRDAFGESTDNIELSRSPEETAEFEPQKNNKYSRPGMKKNFVLLSAKNQESEPESFEYEEVSEPPIPHTNKIHSTLTRSRIKSNNNANQFNFHNSFTLPKSTSSRTKPSNGEKFEIVSIEKSKSHSYYGGSQPEDEFLEGYGLNKRSDNNVVNEFNVGMGISFGGPPSVARVKTDNHNSHLQDTITGVWQDTELLPSNHKFS